MVLLRHTIISELTAGFGQNMKSHGNLLMNKIYNPKNVKPPVPTDVDEADSCMERFIRQKYQYRSLEDGKPKPPSREDASYSRHPESSRRNRSPSGSPEGSPPPLPPKSGKFFGFGLRSPSSTSNLRRFGNKSKGSPPTSDQRPWSPPPSKKTTGLGAPVADVTTASFESKMAALREMGFTNNRRNEMVLRGLNENLERSAETLTRLGEGNGASSQTRPAAPSNNTAPRAVTPNPPTAGTSTNPFERAVSNPTLQQQQSTSYNPFDRPTLTPASAQPLETSFQNLQVSQPLFPHSTGGYPSHASSMPQASYQQPYTPPVTATFSQNGYVSSPQTMDNSYNPFFQTGSQPQGGVGNQTYPNPGTVQNNPFFNNAPQNSSMQNQQQQTAPTLSVPQPPQHANTMPALSSSSPFGNSPFGPTPSYQLQEQHQTQQQQMPNAGQGPYNPFQQAMGPGNPQSAGGYPNQFQSQQPFQQPFQQPQHLAPQATGRMDKNSILSLYNLAPSQPSSIPSIPEQSQFQPGAGTSPVPPLTNSVSSMPQTQPGSNMPTPQPHSTGTQSTASRNPFGAASVGSGLAAQAGVSSYQQSSGLGIGMGSSAATPRTGVGMGMNNTATSTGPPPANSTFPKAHMSRPSVDINGLQNGRHSPDAFASLSARYG